MNDSFHQLPSSVKVFFIKWKGDNVTWVEEFINRKLPALENKTIIETLNGPDGKRKIIEFLRRYAGKFGIPIAIEEPDE